MSIGDHPMLSAGTPLVTRPGSEPVGRLGPVFLQPSTGLMWALSAAQPFVGCDPFPAPAGRAVRFPPLKAEVEINREDFQPADHLIARVRVPALQLVQPNPAFPSNATGVRPRAHIVTEPWRHLGAPLTVFTHRGPVDAVLVSLDSRFEMTNPLSAAPTVFDAALHLRAVDGRQLAVQADAGASVCTSTGGFLGILVAGKSDRAYAAPIGRIVQKHGLTTIEDGRALRRNSDLRKERHPEQALHNQYRKKESRSESPKDDPGGAGKIAEPDNRLADSLLGVLG